MVSATISCAGARQLLLVLLFSMQVLVIASSEPFSWLVCLFPRQVLQTLNQPGQLCQLPNQTKFRNDKHRHSLHVEHLSTHDFDLAPSQSFHHDKDQIVSGRVLAQDSRGAKLCASDHSHHGHRTRARGAETSLSHVVSP